MRDAFVECVCCPDCGDYTLETDVVEMAGPHIIEGRLLCRGCGLWYRIEGGVLDLLPTSLRRHDLYLRYAGRNKLDYTVPRRSAEQQKAEQIAFFAADADSYGDDISESPYFRALDAAFFEPWIERSVSTGSRVLELGCGTGRQCIPLAMRGLDVVGVDISEEMLRLAFQGLTMAGVVRHVDLVVADAENLPIPSNRFEAGVVVGTLHHVGDPGRVIGQIAERLLPGSPFFCYDPHLSPVRFLFDWIMSLWKLYDEQASDDPLFTEEQMQSWTGQSGIEARTIVSTYLPPHLFYLLPASLGQRVLQLSDKVIGSIPGLRRWGGMVITEGEKAGTGGQG